MAMDEAVSALLIAELLHWRKFFRANRMADADYKDANGEGWMSRLDRVLAAAGALPTVEEPPPERKNTAPPDSLLRTPWRVHREYVTTQLFFGDSRDIGPHGIAAATVIQGMNETPEQRDERAAIIVAAVNNTAIRVGPCRVHTAQDCHRGCPYRW
jgi:hypothetical protein